MTDKKITDLAANTNPSDAALYEVDDGGASGKVLNTNIGQLRKVGTALIGGDFTGNARGSHAIDIQTKRTYATEVASGAYSVAIGSAYGGYGNTASGAYGVAIGVKNTASGGHYNTAVGYNNEATATPTLGYATAIGGRNVASGQKSTAIGSNNTVSGVSSSAIGHANTAVGGKSLVAGYNGYALHEKSLVLGYVSKAYGTGATAIGYKSKIGIDKATVISGPLVVSKSDPAFTAGLHMTGPEMVLMTKDVDLTAVADQTITLPPGCRFWFDEIGIICTALDTMTIQPTIRFGDDGTPDSQRTAAITTDIDAVGKRQFYTPLEQKAGHYALKAGVTIGATAAVLRGRFYFKGVFIEDQDFAGYSNAEIGNVDASTVVVTFTENINAAAYDNGVTINVNGSTAVISSATRQANHAIVYYVLNAPVIHTDVVTFRYTKPGAVSYLTNDSGVELANIPPQTVTNNVP